MGRELSRTLDIRNSTFFECIKSAADIKGKGERFKQKQRTMQRDNIQEAAYACVKNGSMMMITRALIQIPGWRNAQTSLQMSCNIALGGFGLQ